jgi:hypothetical protein
MLIGEAMQNRSSRPLGVALAACLLSVTAACAVDPGSDALNPEEPEPADLDTSSSALTISRERAVAAKLGLPPRFAIGLGNDAQSYDVNQAMAYSLGVKPDIHYAYLSGLPGEGGWTDWNAPEGEYLSMHAKAATSRNVVPMFTLYQAAAWGENNLSAFNNTAFMTKYWRGVRVMFDRLGKLGAPSIVHIEPDLWGYAQQRGDDPAAVPMQVGALVPECVDLPANVAGFGRCAVRLGRRLAPKAVIGLSASSFGAFDASGRPDPARVAAYMRKVGGAQSDFIVVETLDRDAGCFEQGTDPNCQRGGAFYWDEANVAHPNFHDHLAWAAAIRVGTGKPLLWWQMPLGVPSSTSGGTAGHYRDNRVRYLFAHTSEFTQIGGLGAVFGTGAGNQTTAKTDGGQFKSALGKYLLSSGSPLK